MGLLARQEKSLTKAGFTRYEIDKLQENLREKPQVVDLRQGVWRIVMRKRSDWIKRWFKSGKSWGEFTDMLEKFYRKSKKASPWDWLKMEYPAFAKGVKLVKDFRAAAARRAKKRLVGASRLGYKAMKREAMKGDTLGSHGRNRR